MESGYESGSNGPASAAPRHATSKTSILYSIIIALFFVSGFSSLIYQVVWTRSLVFVFGSTQLASSTVLAVFMGGLALGSYIAGRYCDRLPVAKALLWYGILEGVIGAWALIAPSMFDALIPMYRSVWQATHLSTIPFSLLRFVATAVILLLPTTCMGATLPLLSHYFVKKLSNVGYRVGSLYAVNTLGAVAGATIAGFYLLPAFGLAQSTLISAIANFVLCAIVIVCYIQSKSATDTAESQPAEATVAAHDATASEEVIPEVDKRALSFLLVAFCLTGGISMVYEVAWTRALLMIIGSTTYAFTVMLSTFLIGIFIGSLVAARLVDRTRQPVAWFAVCEITLCFMSLFSLYLFNYVPYWTHVLHVNFAYQESTALYYKFIITGCILLPISIFIGATFPIVVKASARHLSAVGRSVGDLYSANTLGAIVGAFLAGFVIVPSLGDEKALLLCAVANLAIGIIGLNFCELPVRRSIVALASVLPVIVGIWAFSSGGMWDHLALLDSQNLRRSIKPGEPAPSYEEWQGELQRAKVLTWIDGICSNVGILQFKKAVTMLTNGHMDASDNVDMPTQILVGALPIAVKPDAKDICIVGWGSGVTVGVAAALPDKQITDVELEPAVLQASRYFNHVNLEPYNNPRVHAETNDGRNYLLATDRKFDIIISQPSNPWQAGVCNLFTKDYFQTSKRCLKDGGIFAAWLQTREVSPANVRRVLKALQTAYPYVMPVQTNLCDMVILASDKPLELNLAAARKVVLSPELKAQFARCGITDEYGVAARITNSPAAIAQLTKEDAPNSDDRNFLEYDVSKNYETALYAEENSFMLNHNRGELWSCIDWKGMNADEKAATMARVAMAAEAVKYHQRAIVWAKESLAVKPNAEATRVLAIAEVARGHLDLAKKYLDQALALGPNDPETLVQLATFERNEGNLQAARKWFEQLSKAEPQNPVWRYRIAESYLPSTRKVLLKPVLAADQPELAQKALGNMAADRALIRAIPDILVLQAAILQDQHKPEEALKLMRYYLALKQDDVSAWRRAANLYSQLGQKAQASVCWVKSTYQGQTLVPGLMESADMYLANKEPNRAVEELALAIQVSPGNPGPVDRLEELAKTEPAAVAVLKKLSIP